MFRELNGIFEKVDYIDDSSILLHTNHTDTNYPIHWHPAIEVIMPIESSYQVRMNTHTYNIEENDILIIPPGELHELTAPPTGSRLIILFDYSLIQNIKGLSGIISLFRQPRLITAKDVPEIHCPIQQLLLEIQNEYQSDLYLWEAAVYAKFIEMLLIIGRKYMNTSTLFPDTNLNKQKEYIDKFELIFDYIHQNFSQEISLDSIASIAGFSKFHFSRLFKQFTNMSFYDYLNKERIQSAERLLLSPNLSITEIAFQSGFASISTFNRVFKSVKDCTPTEFRTLYRQRYTNDI